MRVVFMGTPGFAATILENLITHHEVVGCSHAPMPCAVVASSWLPVR